MRVFAGMRRVGPGDADFPAVSMLICMNNTDIKENQ